MFVVDVLAMSTKATVVLAILAFLGCSRVSSDARAAQRPNVSTLAAAASTASASAVNPPVRYRAGVQGGQLTITDSTNNKVLMDGLSAIPFGDSVIKPVTKMTATADGGDMSFTYTNNTNQPQKLGKLLFQGIRLSDRIEWMDVRHTGKPIVNDRFAPQQGYTRGGNWPNDLYSPVCVIRDSNYVMGFQIMYPAVEYKHGVDVVLSDTQRWSGDGGPNWYVHFFLRGTIAPGETRTYTVAVRAAPASEHWLKTLIPYRDYFQSVYGKGASYVRDPRPIAVLGCAQMNNISNANPRGFTFPDRRPDLNGFRPWAKEAQRRQTEMGYQRVMFWALSGLYRAHPERNYPSNAITPVYQFAKAYETRMELANAASPTLSVGYYLGYALNVERGWDTNSRFERVVPTNPNSLSIAMKEHDAARELNATMVGLDAFGDADPWLVYSYMLYLRDRYPNVKYVAELSPPDIIHTLSASFLFDMDVQEPNLMADFLIPGNETWLCNWGQQLAKQLGRRPTVSEYTTMSRRYAQMGYIILDINEINADSSLNAAEGWITNIPADLRTPLPAKPPALKSPPAWRLLNDATPPSGGGTTGSGTGGTTPPPPPPPDNTGNNQSNGPGGNTGGGTTPPLDNPPDVEVRDPNATWGPVAPDDLAVPAAKQLKGSANTTRAAANRAARGATAKAEVVATGVTSYSGAGNAGGEVVDDPGASRRSMPASSAWTPTAISRALAGVSTSVKRAGTTTGRGSLPLILFPALPGSKPVFVQEGAGETTTVIVMPPK